MLRALNLVCLIWLSVHTMLNVSDSNAQPVNGDSSNSIVDSAFVDIRPGNPGAAVIVLRNNEVVYSAEYGIANLEYGIPLSDSSIFDIASISKQFCAMAALLLEADGRLDLDVDVRRYVPELPDFGHKITARHLVHHTSGIRDWPHVMSLGGVQMSDVISFEQILRMLFMQESVNFTPGGEYMYSNTGYNLLALVIERASGMSFREFTREKIFKPLGMLNTHFSDNYREVVRNKVDSYQMSSPDDGAGEYLVATNQLTALGSSSLNTTTHDFALWMQNFDTGIVGGQNLVARMIQPGTLNSGTTMDYAFGLSVGSYRGLPMIGHGGSWAGYRTDFRRFPEQGLSIAIFCNFSDCQPNRRVLEIADSYLADVMGPVPDVLDEPDTTKVMQITDTQLADYVGHYRSEELDSSYRLLVQDGNLIAEHWRNSTAVLTPRSVDNFEGVTRWLPKVRFFRDTKGQVTRFEVSGGRVNDFVFQRVP